MIAGICTFAPDVHQVPRARGGRGRWRAPTSRCPGDGFPPRCGPPPPGRSAADPRAPHDKAVDDQVLLVAGQELGRQRVEGLEPAVQQDAALPRQLGVETGTLDHADGPPELRDDGDLALPDGIADGEDEEQQRGCADPAIEGLSFMGSFTPASAATYAGHGAAPDHIRLVVVPPASRHTLSSGLPRVRRAALPARLACFRLHCAATQAIRRTCPSFSSKFAAPLIRIPALPGGLLAPKGRVSLGLRG